MRNRFFDYIFKRFNRDERELQEFFKELVVPLKPITYLYHPADEVLRAYLAGRLGNEWRLSEPQILAQLTQGRLNDWQRAEVSVHVLTCSRCSRKLSALRAAEPVRLKVAERPHRALRWAMRLALPAIAGAMAFLLLIWLNPDKPSGVGEFKSTREYAKWGGGLE